MDEQHGLNVRAKAVVEDRTIVKQTNMVHTSRSIFDRLLTWRNQRALCDCAAGFADRFMVMVVFSSGRGVSQRCLRHAWRPSPRGTRRSQANKFTFSEVLARAKRKRPANSGTKVRRNSGRSIRGLFRSGPAFRPEYDELYSGLGARAAASTPHCGSLEGRASLEANCHAVISENW